MDCARLSEEFEQFREQAMDLSLLVWTYATLFECGDEQDTLLRGTAGHFFFDLSKWFVELYYLKVGRLTDPAQTRKQNKDHFNLTASYLVAELRNLERVTIRMEALEKRLKDYREKHILDARRKVIGHFDRDVAMGTVTLGKHTRQEFCGFLADLQEFCDEVGRALCVGPLDYGSHASTGDAQTLLNVIERAKLCMDNHVDDRP